MNDEEKRVELKKVIANNKIVRTRATAVMDQTVSRLVEMADANPQLGKEIFSKIQFLNKNDDILGQFAILGLMMVWDSKGSRLVEQGEEFLEDGDNA